MVTGKVGRKGRGWTLTELMIVSALLGIVATGATALVMRLMRGGKIMTAGIELDRDARTAIRAIENRLREAQSGSIVVDAVPGQPPRSRVRFTTVAGREFSFRQEGNRLVVTENGTETTLARDLSVLCVDYPDVQDPRRIGVTISLERNLGAAGAASRRLVTAQVKVMN